MLKFIKNLIAKIAVMFGALSPELKTAVGIGVTITENLKSIMASPVVDILTALIPGGVDDALVAALRVGIPKILSDLKLTQNCINAPTDEAKLQCAVQTLAQLEGDVQSSFLHSFSILVAQVAADQKLTWSDGVYLLQWFYKNNPAKAA